MSFQLSLAAHYLWGRKLRSFLTTLAIVIGVMVIFGMGSVLPTMSTDVPAQHACSFGSDGCHRHPQDRPGFCREHAG